jgi:sec-independent protein translocase protein TatA
MPNVGWGELLLILLVALIVFGPRKLPEMMRSVGQALRAFQQESGRAMDEMRVATDPAAGTDAGVIDRPDSPGDLEISHPATEDT